MDINALKALLDEGLKQSAYPCYAAAVGIKNELLFCQHGGYRSLFPEKLPLTQGTLFDMASLSKLIGTTMAALKLIESNRLRLDNKLGDFFGECYGKEDITVFELMTHTSGIKAHFPLYLRNIPKEKAADEILREESGYKKGENAIYSCMGYILLGKLLERSENEPLDRIVNRLVFKPLGMKNSGYCPKSDNCAATERDVASGEIICGTVHDENARFLGGVSGNAGIFCDLQDAVIFAKMLSNRGDGYLEKSLFESAIKNYTNGFDDDRGLGFQLVGDRFGHTGFTGTSIFADKKSSVFAVLLTNRIHPERTNTKLMQLRKEFHKICFGR